MLKSRPCCVKSLSYDGSVIDRHLTPLQIVCTALSKLLAATCCAVSVSLEEAGVDNRSWLSQMLLQNVGYLTFCP